MCAYERYISVKDVRLKRIHACKRCTPVTDACL
jgi:hypothetical protein